VQGEARNTDTEAAAHHPEDMAKTIDEGDHTKQQISNVHEIASYWR
jgi:Spy/CpxP family protein refolding chaperone